MICKGRMFRPYASFLGRWYKSSRKFERIPKMKVERNSVDIFLGLDIIYQPDQRCKIEQGSS